MIVSRILAETRFGFLAATPLPAIYIPTTPRKPKRASAHPFARSRPQAVGRLMGGPIQTKASDLTDDYDDDLVRDDGLDDIAGGGGGR